jgi:hypothetical protein
MMYEFNSLTQTPATFVMMHKDFNHHQSLRWG